MTMGTVSWLDVVLVLMLCASIGFGFHQGLVRQICLMVAVYLATVLAAQYHGVVSRLLTTAFPGAQSELAPIMAFVLLLGTFSLLTTWSIWTAYRQTKLPSVVMLDEVGGTFLGCLIGIFAISVTLTILQYALQAPWPEGSPIRYLLHIGIRDSGLQSAFGSPLPLIHAALRPWLPDGIPAVLGS